MLDGPECQQTKRSFGGQGYAWFPPIMPCFHSHISLEFLAESTSGLLLYNGPLGPAHSEEQEDFIAIGEFTASSFTTNRGRRADLRGQQTQPKM